MQYKWVSEQTVAQFLPVRIMCLHIFNHTVFVLLCRLESLGMEKYPPG